MPSQPVCANSLMRCNDRRRRANAGVIVMIAWLRSRGSSMIMSLARAEGVEKAQQTAVHDNKVQTSAWVAGFFCTLPFPSVSSVLHRAFDLAGGSHTLASSLWHLTTCIGTVTMPNNAETVRERLVLRCVSSDTPQGCKCAKGSRDKHDIKRSKLGQKEHGCCIRFFGRLIKRTGCR